jgi:RNA polymerase sigma-70 factor, ECF subfamily
LGAPPFGVLSPDRAPRSRAKTEGPSDDGAAVDELGARGRLFRRRLDAAVVPVPTFEEFYLREYPAVMALAYALSGNRWAAEDLAQEAFLAAHRNWDRIAGFEQPGAWVRRVVANQSVSAVRRRIAEAKALGRYALRQVPTAGDLPAESADFWRAVRSLPRRQAQVVALHYLEDRAIADVAHILGMAPGTVKKHLHHGRRALAHRLELQEDEP